DTQRGDRDEGDGARTKGEPAEHPAFEHLDPNLSVFHRRRHLPAATQALSPSRTITLPHCSHTVASSTVSLVVWTRWWLARRPIAHEAVCAGVHVDSRCPVLSRLCAAEMRLGTWRDATRRDDCVRYLRGMNRNFPELFRNLSRNFCRNFCRPRHGVASKH